MTVTVGEQRPPPISSIPREGLPARGGSGASVLAAGLLLVALVVSVLLFYRGNVIGSWDWPGVDSVKLTQESHHLLLNPFPTPATIGQRSTESRSIDVVYTSVMTAVSSLSGVSAENLIRLPAGICLYLLGSLFLLRNASRALRLNLPFAYLLAGAIICSSIYWVSVLWILDEDPWGWMLIMVAWGLLIRAKCTPLRPRDAVLHTALWVVVVLTMNYTYPTVITVNLLSCLAILGYVFVRAVGERVRVGTVTTAISATEAYLGTALIVVVAFTLHPIFGNSITVLPSLTTRALATLLGFFHRVGTSRYEAFVSLSPLALRLLLIQVIIFGTCYVATRLLWERRARSWRPFGAWPVLDGLLLTAIIMPVIAVAWGDSRVFEAVAILMPLTACAVIAAPLRYRTRMLTGIVLVVASLAAGVAFIHDPAGLSQSGISTAELDAGTWAGNTISGPYFADLEVLNPALMANPHSLADAPVVDQHDTAPIAPYYASANSLADRLLQQDYPVAMFTEHDFSLRISLADYPVTPINRAFVFDSGRFNQVYDNGGAGAFVVLPPR